MNGYPYIPDHMRTLTWLLIVIRVLLVCIWCRPSESVSVLSIEVWNSSIIRDFSDPSLTIHCRKADGLYIREAYRTSISLHTGVVRLMSSAYSNARPVFLIVKLPSINSLWSATALVLWSYRGDRLVSIWHNSCYPVRRTRVRAVIYLGYLRVRGHERTLPEHTTALHRKSFILRHLFEIFLTTLAQFYS